MFNDFENNRPVAGFFPWRPAAWLKVSGPDAAVFLQGQFTQDLRRLEQELAVYGLWLNHKGRVLADSFVLKTADQEFWIGSYFSSAAVIVERLEAFIIADDVTLEDQTAQWRGVTILESDVNRAELVALASAVFPGRRLLGPHWECIVRESDVAAITTLTSYRNELSPQLMERMRINARIPAIPADLGPGELPNEGGLESAAISYTKGCFLGQEVMARLKSMGQVRRRLIHVSAEEMLPELPTPLYQGANRIGELRTATESSNGFIGLALVSLLKADWSQRASLQPDGPASVTLTEPLP